MAEAKFSIEVRPESQEMWRSFGKNHFNFTSLLCELVDNSISNFLANPKLHKKDIQITVNHKLNDNKVETTIEDTGSGIKDFTDAFNLGMKNRKHKTDSFLNEHGFGLKNALSTANQNNDDWVVYSRTSEDYDKGLVNIVKAPWKMTFNADENFEGSTKKEKWPGDYNTPGGTYIRFGCEYDLFKSISTRGTKFGKKVKNLVEELSVIYRPFLEEHNINITVTSISNNLTNNFKLEKVFPEDAELVKPSNPDDSLDNPGSFNVGNLRVDYSFYKYPNGAACKERFKYYKHNMSSQGCEIRVNGRLLAASLFEEVWGKKRNNAFNSFWGEIDVVGDRADLPRTSTTKTGFVENDKTYKEILVKIASIFPVKFIPKYDDPNSGGGSTGGGGTGGGGTGGGVNENVLQKRVMQQLKTLNDASAGSGPKTATEQFEVFRELKDVATLNSIGNLDLYMVNGNGEVVLCELKKKCSKLLDIYQLKMYWDGYVYDQQQLGNNVSPSQARLIAPSHPSWAADVVENINQQKDSNENKYNFELKTYDDLGITTESTGKG